MKFSFQALLLLFFILSSSICAQDETINANLQANTPANVIINADPNITKLIKTKFAESNKDTYKIQLYYGGLNKAHSVLSNFNAKFTDWPGKIEYETPNYKVWVGNFQTRLDADRALMKISKSFPHAFIFKPEK
ncbi:SPOR domain-containing protein [Aquimarina agarivorans]|uniref:SPOR domain-containing protein n=1 Tax=Aquimarina agarivorans TaxID=980584 RepID=UPI000248FCB1|nr:SPOR domain-containing protein [Aquimarina agarivorans]